MIKANWKVSLLCAALLASTPFARAKETKPVAAPETPATVVEQVPKDWLAFLVYQGGFTSPEYNALNQTPYIMLFQNGRLFWRDDNIKYDAPYRRRDMWRESKISAEALRTFVAKAKLIDFLTIQPTPKVAPKPDANGLIHLRPVICDAATTVLGVRKLVPMKSKRSYYRQRVISEYALGAFSAEDKDDTYIQSLLTMQKLLLDLRPKESKRYEPEAIRVTFLDGNTRGAAVIEPGTIVPAWPLTDKPHVEGANIYFGEAAKKLVEILTEKPVVKIGDGIYTAIWTPAIAVPQKLPATTVASPKSPQQ